MTFAPEDKRAWQASEVMAELEQIAKKESLLDGPPPEAFQPLITEAEEEETSSTWEDESSPSPAVSDANDGDRENSAPIGVGEINGLEAALDQTKAGLKAMASNLAVAGRVIEAHKFERAVSDINQMDVIADTFCRMLRLAEDLGGDGHEALADAVERQAGLLLQRTQPAVEPHEQEEGDA